MDEREDSPLQDVQNKLYGSAPVPVPKASELTKQFRESVRREWEPEEVEPQKSRISIATWFLIGAVLFFVVAGAVALGFLYFGTRSVSVENVDVYVSAGTSSIASGDTVELTITIENRNPAPISDTTLTVDFPEGTRTSEESGELLPRYTDTVGTVLSGEKVTRTVRAVVSGEANAKIELPVSFTYKTEGSNALFEVRESELLTITSSPVSVSVSALSETASGQPLTFSVRVRANGTEPVENVSLLVEYPFGFSLTEANPKPTTGSLFTLGTINPGETKTITLSGTLTAEQGDERVFKFSAGTQKGTTQALAVRYTTQETKITVTRPFLSVGIALNREEGDPVIIRSGGSIDGVATWVNTLPTTVTDGVVSIALSGTALDATGVRASTGYYRSTDKTIVFNRDTTNSLKSLGPQDSGTGSFSIGTKSGASLEALTNPTVVLTVSISGKRIGESGVLENVTSTLTKTVKVATDLSLSTRAVRTIGPFTNTGVWPPKVDQETTYTIMMTAKNTVNAVAGAKAGMVLPQNVRFTGSVSPSDGSLIYNSSTREVIWTVGDMGTASQKQMAFQVALLPSYSEKGTSPVLVGEQSIVGTDRFIQAQVKMTHPSVNARTTSDPAYISSYGVVSE